MTLDDLWRLTRRHFILISVAALIGTLLAGAWMLTRPKLYTATSQGIVQVPTGDSVSSNMQAQLLATQRASQYLPYFSNRNVTKAVIEELGLDMAPETLTQRVSAQLPKDSSVITVSATASDPREARDIADAMIKAATAEARRVEASAPTTTTRGPDGDMVEVENVGLVRMQLSQSALLPSSPSSPRPERILPIGLLLGLFAGYLIAMVKHRSDTRLRLPAEVEKAAGSSVLGVIPASDELGSARGDAGPAKDFANREALRKLRTNLRFVDVDNQPRSIVVSSANIGEGKSTIASHLAWVLAQSGEQVVLIDADLRRPALAHAFDVDDSVGLSQVLAGTASLHDAIQPTDQTGLRLLTAGTIPPNPSELLGSHRMEALIEQLVRDHFVVLDAPPLLPVTDAVLLTRSADGALLVVVQGKTRQEEVERASASLRAVGGKVLGAVLNRASGSRLNKMRYGGEYVYAYGRGYGYGQEYVQAAEERDRGAADGQVSRRSRKQKRAMRT